MSVKRVLLVVGCFKPAMLADMHRARMLAWELRALGWDVEVLTPRETEVRQDVVERDADAFFPPDTIIHTVGSLAKPVWTMLGSRTHGWRTLLPMDRAGQRLLRSERFDVVYFS